MRARAHVAATHAGVHRSPRPGKDSRAKRLQEERREEEARDRGGGAGAGAAGGGGRRWRRQSATKEKRATWQELRPMLRLSILSLSPSFLLSSPPLVLTLAPTTTSSAAHHVLPRLGTRIRLLPRLTRCPVRLACPLRAVLSRRSMAAGGYGMGKDRSRKPASRPPLVPRFTKSLSLPLSFHRQTESQHKFL